MQNIIKAENLIFEYQKESTEELKKAVNDVSFEIEKGSFVAIIGRNGSGKSTLAKNLNALLVPTSGTLWVNGYDTKQEEFLWDIRRTCGMVFQNPDNQLVSTMVEDDVAFGPENLGIEPELIRERVDYALNAVNMYEHRKKPPHLLSGGQKQRIAIAGVLAMKPDCIVLDEPTAMLDPRGRKEVLRIARELNREGITIILITHFMEEVTEADKIMIMVDGKFVMSGTPVEIFAQPGRLEELNLDVPMVVALSQRLREKGIEMPKDIVTEEDFSKYVKSRINANRK